LLETRGDFRGIDFEVDDPTGDVDKNGIAFLNDGDGSAVGSFGGDVGDHETVGGAAEASVGDEGDAFGEAGSDDGAGNAEHLTHAGSTTRTFITNDDDVSGLDATLGNGGHGVFFAFEDAGGAVMEQFVMPGEFDDAALGREGTAQDLEAAGGFQRVGEGSDNLLAGCFASVGGFFSEGTTGAGKGATVDEVSFDQALCNDADSAG
jgi:hypothetical protein